MTLFFDYGHIYVSNGGFWGFYSGPHIGNLVVSLFFTLGSTTHGMEEPKNGPILTKNGQSGPFWVHLDPFGLFQAKIHFSLAQGALWILGAKKYFLPEKDLKGPNDQQEVYWPF